LECTKAYVVGRRSGRIRENPLKMGETITAGKGPEDERGAPICLDIEAEFSLLEKIQLALKASSTTHTASTSSVKDTEAKHLKELGLQRLVTLKILL
jgi:hypothetical protein